MTMRPAGADAVPFAPAAVHRVAPALDADTIHLWWLPYRHGQGRVPLKALLAAYLDTDPDTLPLVENDHGRPRLAAPHALDFNWSHSGHHAMVAVARALPELGVDIERQRPHPRALALARRFLPTPNMRCCNRCRRRSATTFSSACGRPRKRS